MPRLLAVVVGVALGTAPPLLAQAPAQPALGLERELILPAGLTHAVDLRWWEPEELLITSALEGTMRFELAEPSRSTPFWPADEAPSLRSHGRLALGGERVVVAAPLFAILHGARDGGELSSGPAFEFIDDLDVHGARLVVLGTRRDDDGETERGIAWETRLDQPDAEARPLVLSATRRNSLGACGAFAMGAVRFLADGSLVVVPGTEPDVYLFGPDGTLRRTWQTDRLGIDSGCRLAQDEVELLGRDQPARWRWLARRRTVDEILPLPDGSIGLVVRDATGGDETRWHLLRLDRRGPVRRIDLPLRSPDHRAFLRGDVHGGRIAFLIGRQWSREQPLEGPPRLLIGRLPN